MKCLVKLLFLTPLSLLFNGELFAHGVIGLFNTELLLFYFMLMSASCIVKNKFKFDAKKMYVFGGVTGLVFEAIVTKALFVEPTVLGVNWLSVISLFLIWGSAVLIPFYIVKNYKSSLSKNRGFSTILAIYLIIQIVFNSQTPFTDAIFLLTGVALGLSVVIAMRKDLITI